MKQPKQVKGASKAARGESSAREGVPTGKEERAPSARASKRPKASSQARSDAPRSDERTGGSAPPEQAASKSASPERAASKSASPARAASTSRPPSAKRARAASEARGGEDDPRRAGSAEEVARDEERAGSEPPRQPESKEPSERAAGRRRSRPPEPSVDLTHGVNGVSPRDKPPSSQVAKATVAPPSRRPRAADEPEAPDDQGDGADEQIWSDQAPSTQPLASATRKLAAELAAESSDASAQAESRAAFRLTRGSSGDRLREAAGFGGGDRLREAAAFGSAQSLLATDYYFRQYGAHGMRSLAAEVDDFGFDPHVDERVRPLLEALCRRYFRVEVVGAEHLPESGRALLVANRSGALPWDGLVLRTALRAKRPDLTPLRWLSEDSVIHYPFMGVLMNRLGAVRACPENAERLLAQQRLVAVFPEGAQGSRKLFRDRYRLQRFGRGGYVKLALKFGLPILPTAIIGAEETNPVLGRSRLLGRIVGSESLPITPTFPWLGPAGLLPAPVRWRIVVGEPIDLSAHGAAAADDALVVHRLNEQIRSSLQALVDQGKRTRGSALFR